MEPEAEQHFPISVLKDIVRYLGGKEAAKDSHKWIEELMVLYNKEAAKVLIKQQNGIIRAHSQPSQEKLSAVLAAVGPEVAAQIATAAAKYFAASAAAVAATDAVTASSFKHWSLGNDFYCHATSPIRRYADLVNQRILKGQLSKTNMTEVAKYLNERQKVIKQVDRDIFFIKQLNDNGKVQKGIILLKTENGSWKIWVPEWKRIITYRPGLCYAGLLTDESSVELKEGAHINFTVYFDPNRPNWKQRLIVQILKED
jgi:hypothetical protein